MHMSILEQLFFGIALAMDCFSVSIASGLSLKKFIPKCIITMAICFGFFQGMMPVIGWIATVYIGDYIESFDHWIAFALLAYIGGKMIQEGLKPEEEHTFNPTKLTTIITLSIATSIDALAVGVSFTCMGLRTFIDILSPILIIGATSTLLSFIGYQIGITIGKRFRFPANIVGGIILILIGVKILVEHLYGL